VARHAEIVVPETARYLLHRARVPACFLAQPVDAAPDADGAVLLDLVIDGGRIASIASAGASPSAAMPVVDVEGRQVWATLVDMHAHLDKGQIFNRTPSAGTLGGAALATIADRRHWSHQDIAHRMGFGIRCAYVHGVSAIRTHIDSHAELAERSWEVFRGLRAEWAGRVALQGVGLVPLTAFGTDYGRQLADLVADCGGVLGGSTDAIGNYRGAADTAELDALLDTVFRLAGERGLDVDLHVDQSDNLAAYSLPNIAAAVLRTGYQGRVVADHCVNLALQPEAVVLRTLDACAAAGIAFVTLPTPMMYLQDRVEGRTPRWRGVTLAKEIHARGIPIAIAGDNCRDAWFPFGDHDMVDTFQQAVRVYQLDAPIAAAVAMAGPIPSGIIGTEPVGSIAAGAPARLILFAARTLNEMMCRPQADRIVIDRGRRVTDPLPEFSELDPAA